MKVVIGYESFYHSALWCNVSLKKARNNVEGESGECFSCVTYIYVELTNMKSSTLSYYGTRTTLFQF